MNSPMLAPRADLTVCDREPITRLQRIQNFGFLIAMSSDWNVSRASANLHQYLGVSGDDAIGMPVADLIDALGLHDIRNRLTVLVNSGGIERLFGVQLRATQPLCDVAMHYTEGLLVVEGERSGASNGTDAASLVRTMIARLNTRTTMSAFHADCARQVRAITGFQRVMVYRFDEAGAGEVIAESLARPMESFVGLHYPASDIPVQARALYLRNPFRIIADVDGETVAILPAVSALSPALDLSLAITRAVSPVHLEYLRNMGVVASMSMSIVVDGKLWGLIACHNDEPGVPTFVMRSASELFAQMYSLTLENRIRQATSSEEHLARDLTDRMISSMSADPGLLIDATWMHGALRQIIPCDGVAVFVKGRMTTSGSIPPPSELTRLVRMLDGAAADLVFVTDQLTTIRAEAAAYAPQASGLLAIPISDSPRDYLLLFRREVVESTRWGGDPDAAVKVVDVERVSPRKSFAAFTKLVRGRSASFDEAARQRAAIIRSALLDLMLRFTDGKRGEHRRVTERQETLIAELNHRVRNILALIRGLINQSGTGGADVASYVQSLNGRVQALARAHDQVTRKDWGPGLLSSLFDDEIEAYVPLQRERFSVAGRPVFLQPLAFSTMALVVHELVTNSSKYGALSDSGRVTVAVHDVDEEGLRIEWREYDGPVVTPPTRRGFGSAIIERTIPFELQGSADVRYPAHGIEVDLVIPASYVWTGPVEAVAQRSSVATVGAVPLPVVPLDGMGVLLLEDNMIVALETEDLLRDLGAREVWAVATIAAAEALLDRHAVDFAVLDVNVGSETSVEFAGRIEAQGIPFIFASGYGADVDFGGRFGSTPVVKKPYQSAQASRAIGQTLGLHRDRAR